MTAPLSHRTHEATASTGASASHGSKGHHTITLFVSAPNVDPANDTLTVAVEASPDGEQWTTLTRSDGSEVTLQAADLDSEGNGMAAVDGVIASQLRVNITDYSDAAGGDLGVDSWLTLGGWDGPSHSV